MKAKNGHTAEMAHRCPVRHFWLSAMPGIKKRKKSAHMARHDKGLQDNRTDLPSWSQRCHPTPKPAGTTDAPCLPSRQEDCLCLPPPFHHSHRTCPPGAGTLPFVSRHDGCALSGSCLQRVRDTSRPGVGLSTGKGRPAAPPCPSAWTRWLRDADGRNAAGGQAPEPGLPLPVSALLLTDGPQ